MSSAIQIRPARSTPALSHLFGRAVTVTPLPPGAAPSLEDFLAQANQPALTDVGLYRTLRPKSRNYDLNGTFATPLASWLTANTTLRLTRSNSHSLRGLPAALFIVSDTNAFTPFATDVGLAFYGPNPLRSTSRRTSGDGNLTLNAIWGRWNATWNTSHQRSNSVSRSESASSSNIRLDDDVNPFAGGLTNLITLRNSSFSSRTRTTSSVLTANGPVANLPAGPLIATIEGRLAWDRVRSESSFGATETRREFNRNEQSIRAALDIPLTSKDGNFFAGIGNLDANLEYGRSHFSHVGTLNHYAAELNWQPLEPLRINGSIERNDNPPTAQTLGDPITITPGVRTFDPLTGETVDVTQITGGEPRPVAAKDRHPAPQRALQARAEAQSAAQRRIYRHRPAEFRVRAARSQRRGRARLSRPLYPRHQRRLDDRRPSAGQFRVPNGKRGSAGASA